MPVDPALPLIDGHDAALFDLDGVIYLGPAAVPGAAEGIAALRQRGVAIGFVTNNAARGPQAVAHHLTELGVSAEVGDVVTSAQACARLMAEQLPPGSTVLVVGAQALVDEIRAVGLTPVGSVPPGQAPNPGVPVAVVQGYDPQLTWPRLDEACHAIQQGARWYATNTDSTRPTDRGLVPGAGSQIAVVRAAVEVDPVVAGKPCIPLMDETVRRLAADRPIFVGDRIDTDIMGAVAVGMDSLFVFTGAHGKADLAAADPSGRPTHLGWDLGALLHPARQAIREEGAIRCGQTLATVLDGAVTIDQRPTDREGQLDALWAALQMGWGTGADLTPVLPLLDKLP